MFGLEKKTLLVCMLSQIFIKLFQKHVKNLLKISVVYQGPVQAPIKKDDILGKIKIKL